MKKKLLIMLWLLAICLVPTYSLWAETPSSFKDTTGQWWEQPIAECNVATIVNGRGAGIFAPSDAVTRLEAVVLLNRALGHRDDADNYSMSQGDYGFSSDFPEWGKKNVAYAADKGYISKSGIAQMDPKHPASRAEIAVLFANALKLSGDGYQLSFTDKDAIPSNLQPYVAAAVKNGVMVGRTGNKFDPNANVSRGEMAVIIARLFEQGKINPYPQKYFITKLISVDGTNKNVTVVKDGQNTTLTLASSLVCYRDGKKVNLSSIKANENVKVILGDDGKVNFLAYTAAGATSSPGTTSTIATYTGTITSLLPGNQISLVFQPDSGANATYQLSSNVKVTQNGSTKDLTALSSGVRAEIKVSGGSVTEINLLAPTGTGLKGYLVNSNLEYITVHYDNGTSEQLQKSTITANIFGLSTGQRVEIFKNNGLITNITQLDEPKKFFGFLVHINSDEIDYQDDDNYERSLGLASNYRITDNNGDAIDKSDLKTNDPVEIQIDDQGKAQLIKLSAGTSNSSDYQGEVTYIKTTSGSLRLTIKKSDGNEKTYEVKDSVEVYRGSRLRYFNDINEGDYVQLKVNSSDEVTRIDIVNVQVIEGDVVGIDTTADDQLLTIMDANGKRQVYNVINDVKVYENTYARSFRNIRSGNHVRLVLNTNGDVSEVNISGNTGSGSYSGTIYSLDIQGQKITIKQNDTTYTYTLDSNVTVRDTDGSLNLNQVIIGSECNLTMSDNKVQQINITEDQNITIEGVLDKISAGRVYIEQDNGNGGYSHRFLLNAHVSLKDNDDKPIDLSYLGNYVGKNVEVELVNNEVDYLKVK